MEYFVIGERELVLAFGLVGVAGEAVVNREEALAVFSRVTDIGGNDAHSAVEIDRPKVLIVTETVAAMLEDEIRILQMKGLYPLLVEIPGLQGHLDGKKSLTDAIREAIGIHV